MPLQKEDAEKREKNLEEAKQIVLTEDSSLPAAKKVSRALYTTLYSADNYSSHPRNL